MSFARRAPTVMLGVPIDDLTLDQTLDAIGELVDDGRANGRSHQIATVNVDFLVNALDDPEVRNLLQGTSLNLADGLPLVWGARLAGLPVQERVAGADLVPLLGAVSADRGWKVYFFGSAPGVAERALEIMEERNPGATVSGTSGPMMPDVTDIDDEVLDDIAAHSPDILCVALGNPKQERFIAAHRDRLNVPVMIGIGGSLDMLVGDKKRAPRWAQRGGLEWLFRAAQEPRRLGQRYARDAVVFGPRLTSYLRLLRSHGDAPELAVDVLADQVIVGTHRPSRSDDATFDEAVDAVLAGSDLVIDYDGGLPNPAGLARLIGLARTARRLALPVLTRHVDARVESDVADLSLPGWLVLGSDENAAPS